MSRPAETDARVTESGPVRSGSRSKRAGLFLLVFALSLLLTVFLQNRSGSHGAELSGYPDEPAHYVTGLMFHTYLDEGHFRSPIAFAEDYYLHYPKVAIGHWPPVYYLVQCLWTAVFPTTISSILYLQAILLAFSSAILFAVAASRFGPWVALVLSVAFLILHPTQELGSEVMSEPLLALTTLGATWSIARYFETGESLPLIGFVVLAEVDIHIKGSGLALAGVPILLAVSLRRMDVFRKRIFWLAQAAMILVLLPWQILTRHMVQNGMDGPVTPGLVLKQLLEFGPITARIFGWPLLLLILFGLFLAVVPKKLRDPLLVSSAVTAVLTLLFHSVSPNGAEDRRLFMAIPGAMLLAPLPFFYLFEGRRRSWAPALLFAAVAISLFSSVTLYRKTAVGYRSVADWLLAESGRGENAVLIASDIDGEGMLISEIGQLQPKPALYLVRSSKVFEDCDWQAEDCRPIITDPARAEQALDSIPVRYAILDQFSGVPSNAPTELLRRMIAANSSLWTLRTVQPAIDPNKGHRGEILIYERVGLALSDHVHVSVDLHRMIGKVIGK